MMPIDQHGRFQWQEQLATNKSVHRQSLLTLATIVGLALIYKPATPLKYEKLSVTRIRSASSPTLQQTPTATKATISNNAVIILIIIKAFLYACTLTRLRILLEGKLS